MTNLFLSRARLRSDASSLALASVLVPDGRLAPHAGKALVWSLCSDEAGRTRDFLWRWDAGARGRLSGEFLILSKRPPTDPHGLFHLETKEFAPRPAPGDRLQFRLRANPVIRRRSADGRRSKKSDVVMDALRAEPEAQRAQARLAAIQSAGSTWLHRQLLAAGAELDPAFLRIDGYTQHEAPRPHAKPVRFSSLDFDGVLTVTEPALFLHAQAHGFGAGKAYGCGLLLIRRA